MLGRFRNLKQRDPSSRRAMFITRTDEWRQVGLGGEIDREQSRRARVGAVVSLVALVAVIAIFARRGDLIPEGGTALRIATAVALVAIGWALARFVVQGFGPPLLRRLEPGTAGTVGFLVRFGLVIGVVVAALRIAGVSPETLAVGGAFTAVVLGLAAQQTIANLFAGLVLASARPFRLGDRVKLIGGGLAGQVDGIVGQLGLFYTTLISGADRISIPNSVVLNLAVVPLREPERVELRARVNTSVTPDELERTIRDEISVPIRYPPQITLEELDGDELTVKILATPASPDDGAKLAADVLRAVRDEGGEEPEPVERAA
jgi:small-conductance mechanosensitive channel